jgi:hypothetical protein
MKKDVKCFLGMDVSKLWVDITLLRVVNHQKQATASERFDRAVKQGSKPWINGWANSRCPLMTIVF